MAVAVAPRNLFTVAPERRWADEGARPYKFNVTQYHRLFDKGVLPWALRTELLDGIVYEGYRRGSAPHLWTREEYHRLGEAGILRADERVQLIEGEIIEMSPQKARHALAVLKVERVLRRIFGRRFHVRSQLPLAVGPNGEPEPDVAVVAGKPEDYAEDHPKTAALVVEVSDTTLRMDRVYKASLYARAGIAEYWVLNLVTQLLEVNRDPTPDARAQYGYAYKTRRTVEATGSITPLAAPGKPVKVADLLP
jgi:Uma2 family endonuclease